MNNRHLIEKCKLGDSKAMEYLYRKYSYKMMQIVRTFITDKSTAQDILHDGFIIVFTHISQVRKPERLESWMGSIMKNLAIKYITSQQDNLELHDDMDIADESSFESMISHEDILKIIDHLPDGYKKIFNLSVIENKSHVEIGSLLGIAPHSSSSQLFRAKSLLRELISNFLKNKGYWCFLLILLITPFIGYIFNGFDRSLVFEKITQKGVSDNGKHGILPINDVVCDNSNHICHVDTTEDKYADQSLTLIKKSDKHCFTQTESSIINEKVSDIIDEASVSENEFFSDTIKQNFTENAIFDDVRLLKNNLLVDNPQSYGNKICISFDSYLAFGNRQRYFSYIIPDFTSSVECLDSVVSRYVPISFSISAQYSIGEKYGIEAGVKYSCRKAQEVKHLRQQELTNNYTAHFIGIPVNFNYKILEYKRIVFYASGGLDIDIPIDSKVECNQINGEANKTYKNKYPLPVLWSLNGGLGLEYNVSSSLWIYVQPSIQYHLNSTERYSIYYKNPYEVVIPVGLRLKF